MKPTIPIAAARLYYEKKNYEACIKALQKVPPDDPGFRKASFSWAGSSPSRAAHPRRRQVRGAIDGEEVNETVIIYYSLALAHEANLRPREALSAYQKVLSYDYATRTLSRG